MTVKIKPVEQRGARGDLGGKKSVDSLRIINIYLTLPSSAYFLLPSISLAKQESQQKLPLQSGHVPPCRTIIWPLSKPFCS